MAIILNDGVPARITVSDFKSSYLGVVSSLIEEEEVSLEDLKKLIRQVEESSKK